MHFTTRKTTHQVNIINRLTTYLAHLYFLLRCPHRLLPRRRRMNHPTRQIMRPHRRHLHTKTITINKMTIQPTIQMFSQVSKTIQLISAILCYLLAMKTSSVLIDSIHLKNYAVYAIIPRHPTCRQIFISFLVIYS